MKKEKIRYYKSFTDDFSETANQNFVLPDNYKWIKKDFFSKLLSAVIYAIAVLFGEIYCRCFLHITFNGKKNFKKVKGGFFVYANHTQPLGDVFTPALAAFPKRIYTVVSTANYGIPVIGKILPYLGAIPIVNSLSGMKEFNKALEYRVQSGHPVIIYPEAHVWEYYTGIRPFSDTSFKPAVKLNKPVFAMTVTYRKSKFYKKPKSKVFIDGPFYPIGNTLKEKSENLYNQVLSCMKNRSLNSNFEYIKYLPY